jgi:hypothetical protein
MVELGTRLFQRVFGDRPFLRLGIMSFCYTALVALSIQWWLLPHVMPHLHAGHGLLVGGDWLEFHRVATGLAQKIAQEGWGVWQLRPLGHAPAGVAAIFYTIFIPEPWVLVPLNAALHASATVLLACIVRSVTNSIPVSILAALPFLFYPSASAWYAQIHKDGFFIAGFYAYIYGWVLLLRMETWKVRRRVVISLFWIVAGTLLIGLMRDYGVQLAAVLGLLFAIVVAFRMLKDTTLGWVTWRRTLTAVFVFLAPFVLAGLSSNHYKAGAPRIAQNPGHPKHNAEQKQITALASTWRRTAGIPHKVDEYLYALSALRHGHVINYPDARSTVDTEVRFDSAEDFLPYLPRAMQIGLLAPFPAQWFSAGNIEAGTVMRRISALEMTGVYAALLFLPYGLWRWRRQVESWLMAAGCVFLVTLYAYVIPNVGTLYRMRYGFLMAVVALGVAAVITLIKQAPNRVSSGWLK